MIKMAKTKYNILDVINGISEVVMGIYDGVHDTSYVSNEEPKSIGLSREEGHMIYDSRVIDGFGCKFVGRNLILNYSGECRISDVHQTNFEDDILATVEKVISFIKKEYRKNNSASISLNQITKDPVVTVQYLSKVKGRFSVTVVYEISNLEEEATTSPYEKRFDKKFKKFLELKSDKKAENQKPAARKNDKENY